MRELRGSLSLLSNKYTLPASKVIDARGGDFHIDEGIHDRYRPRVKVNIIPLPCVGIAEVK